MSLRLCLVTCVLIALPATASPTPTPTPAPKKLSGGIVPSGVSAPTTTTAPFGFEAGSLADAARKNREERDKKKASLGVITNESLKKSGSAPRGAGTATSSRGTLSIAPASGGRRQPVAAPTPAPVTDLRGQSEADWRARVSGLKERISAAEADLSRLEGETRRLENDFFAWSDGNYRDGVIKPAWDRAKEDLRNARSEVDSANQAWADLEEEARKSGTPPGWLR